ncbi:hypothetical protein UR09_06420 [Candidatus Nitromaritima sp. SCGC AAA799-A02]|nr:hypothetical protein UR09_06420 [Candidatus Nitromaritima sp. SCGC AAA799-A02]KMP11221.1 hypothetical protein UZ36_05180 [Candidatus Nitromaritima sp. SCGC AAA799-C22]
MASTPAAGLDPKNFFEVRAWMWEPGAYDYTVELAGGKGRKTFGEFIQANDYFDSLEYGDLCAGQKGDLKLEIVHLRMGTPHRVRTRILFPT